MSGLLLWPAQFRAMPSGATRFCPMRVSPMGLRPARQARARARARPNAAPAAPPRRAPAACAPQALPRMGEPAIQHRALRKHHIRKRHESNKPEQAGGGRAGPGPGMRLQGRTGRAGRKRPDGAPAGCGGPRAHAPARRWEPACAARYDKKCQRNKRPDQAPGPFQGPSGLLGWATPFVLGCRRRAAVCDPGAAWVVRWLAAAGPACRVVLPPRGRQIRIGPPCKPPWLPPSLPVCLGKAGELFLNRPIITATHPIVGKAGAGRARSAARSARAAPSAPAAQWNEAPLSRAGSTPPGAAARGRRPPAPRWPGPGR